MTESGSRLAVTGMAMGNSLGNSIEDVWAATLAMKSGVGPVERKFDEPPDFYDASSYHPGLKSYCDVLAHMRIKISRESLGVPPQDFRVMSNSSRFTLFLAERAIAMAGLDKAGYDPRRVAVICSQNAGEAASTLWDLNLSMHSRWIAELAGTTLNLDENQKKALHAALLKDRLLPDESTMLCRLNGTTAGMISNKHNFAGPSFSVGSACSSSLMALYSAFNMMRLGLIDAAVIGGAEEAYSALWLAEFSAIGALARRVPPYDQPAAMSRPFDLKRTGFVFGEGGAVVVVERESAARKRGAHVFGLVGGAGCVTNTRGLVEPSAEAQVEATRQSFIGVDYGPEAVDLIECHATATPQGDREEGLAMFEAYSGRGICLSAYKSQIGHTVGSSGAMALIHGLLSMRDKILPGTLNYDNPDPSIGLEERGFRILPEPAPWPAPAGGIRRMQVNSFGFGGSNLVFQVEEFNDRVPGKARVSVPDNVGASDGFEGREETLDGVNMVLIPHQGAEWRLGSVNPAWRMELAGLAANPSPEDFEALGRKGLWLGRNEKAPPLAVMCCGQGSIWPGAGRAIYDALPAAREAMDTIARVADWDVLGLMDDTDPEKITLTRWQQPYLFLLEYAQFSYLRSLGLSPSAMMGHSLGELIALCLSGVYTPKEAWYIVDTRACLMGRLERESDRGTGMMALHAPPDEVRKVLEEYPELGVSNYNSPNQVILGGPRDLLLEARRNLRKRKMPAIMLPMSLAFHNPRMRVLRDESLDSMQCVDMRPSGVPMLSNVTAGLYPGEHADIIRYIADLDENPVRWPDCVHAMWNEHGARHFLELGPADVLCGLVGDIIPEAVSVSACRKGKELEGMRIAVARLFALGHLPFRPGAKSSPASNAGGGEQGLQASGKAGGPSAPAAPQPADPLVEAVMPVIMEATGYERHELGPDMDLRHDLSIRSSRFPLIMHEAEKRFNISMGFEDLLGVATIRDLAYKIAELRKNGPVDALRSDETRPVLKKADEKPAAPAAPKPVLRYAPELFALDELAPRGGNTVSPGRVFCFGRGECAAGTIERLAALYGRDKIVELDENFDPAVFSGKEDRALFIFADEEDGVDIYDPTADLSADFALIKSFLSGRGAKVCCAAGKGHGVRQAGLLGIFLSAALENPSVAFHCLDIADGAPENWPQTILRAEKKPSLPVLLVGRNGKFYSKRPRPVPIDPGNGGLKARKGDVVLVSGGAGGIAAEALKGLAELGCVLVVLGRSPRPGADAAIWKLASLGAVVEYFSCDITDLASVSLTVNAVREKYGRIDGIFHAAGLLRDAAMDSMDGAQFAEVVSVKCLGLRNLAALSVPLGLRYALGFSSMAAWLGNYGQANYSAANTAMARMMEKMGEKGVTSCCIMLPPVAGKGMAGELSEEMKLRGLGESFIKEDELGDLFRREICCASGGGILWARHLPEVPGVYPPFEPDKKALAGIVDRPDLFPLVFPVKSDGMTEFNGGVHFSFFRHKWLAAGKGENGISLVPPGMGLECLFEAAGQLMPWTAPLGARNLRWDGVISCREGVTREGAVVCRRLPAEPGDNFIKCAVGLDIVNVSANGRRQGSSTAICAGEILMAAPNLCRRTLPGPENAVFTANFAPEEIAIAGESRYIYPLALFGTACSSALAFMGKKQDFTVHALEKLDFISNYEPCAGVDVHLRPATVQSAEDGAFQAFDVWAAQGDVVLMCAFGLKLRVFVV